MTAYKQADLKKAATSLGFKHLFEPGFVVSYRDLCQMLIGEYVLPELKPRIYHNYVSLNDIVFDGTTDDLVNQFRELLERETKHKKPDSIEIDGDSVCLGWYEDEPYPADVVMHEGLKTISNLVTAYADKIIAEYERISDDYPNSVGKSKS